VFETFDTRQFEVYVEWGLFYSLDSKALSLSLSLSPVFNVDFVERRLAVS
jgi:hypothetical protein